jgi:hypothetical protein
MLLQNRGTLRHLNLVCPGKSGANPSELCYGKREPVGQQVLQCL